MAAVRGVVIVTGAALLPKSPTSQQTLFFTGDCMSTTSRDFAKAMSGLPAMTSAAIAVRAALRVLPVVGRLDLGSAPHQRMTVLTLLCCRSAKLNAVLPSTAAASAASAYAGDVANDAAYDYVGDVAYAAASAARNPADAAASAADTAAAIHEDVSLARGARVSLGGLLGPTALDAAQLLVRPLWHDAIPIAAAQAWAQLKSRLLALDKDFDIWVEWYEQQHVGNAPLDEALEVKLLLSQERRSQSAAEINAHLKSIIRGESRRVSSTACAPSLSAQAAPGKRR